MQLVNMAANPVYDKPVEHVHNTNHIDTHIQPITDQLIQSMKSDVLFLSNLQTHINYWHRPAQPEPSLSTRTVLDIVLIPGLNNHYNVFIFTLI